ncbi:MAG: phosphoserine phosphatase SerB [Pseudomonadota bacterium]
MYLLINVTGHDSPGVTLSLSRALQEHSAVILDIGQAVILNTLNLGLLVQVANKDQVAFIMRDIVLETADRGLSVRFTPIDPEAIQATQEEQFDKKRYIVTLLARHLNGAHIQAVTQAIFNLGLNITRIHRLSSSITPVEHAAALTNPSNDVNGLPATCIELRLDGKNQPFDHLKSRFLTISQQFDIDIAFQKDTPFRRNRRLVCFDMDSTLIQCEVIDELAKAAGVGEQVSEITERAMRGELDFKASFRERVALLKGLPESALQDLAQRLPLSEGAERLVKTLKRLGYTTAIVSGGFTYFGEALKKQLGVDHVFANTLAMKNGVVTGEVEEPIVDGARKATILRQLADAEKINLEQVIAVGDGANDLPMLNLAGLGIAFRAKPLVKASAQYALDHMGLDGILYLLGVSDEELDEFG